MAERTARKNAGGGPHGGMGGRIRERRGELAMSQRDLSGESGVSADVIVKLERDARRPRPSTVKRLANALGVTVEYLTTGRERARRSAPVSGGPPGRGSVPASPGPAVDGPARPTRERPRVEVLVSGEPDEESARMLERWIEEERAAEAAGEPDPWPEIARSLDEDRTSYRKLFER